MAEHAVAIRRRFDLWARVYDDASIRPVYQLAHLQVLNQIAALEHPCRRLLDLGCGTGRFLEAARLLVPRIDAVGVDASTAMLDVAQRSTPGIVFARASAEELPFRRSAFDVVTAIFTARHWSDPARAFAEIRRVLAPNGTLVIADAFAGSKPAMMDRLRSGVALPQVWQRLIAAEGLVARSGRPVDGFGPIPVIGLYAVTKPA